MKSALIIVGTISAAFLLSIPDRAQCQEREIRPDVLVFGVSKHSTTRPTNDFNFGLGAEAAYRTAGDRTGWSWEPFAGGFAMRDSLYKLGGAAYGGARVRHTWESGTYADISLRAGYMVDEHFRGVAALPTLGFGYKSVGVEIAYIPKRPTTYGSVWTMFLHLQF